MAEQSVNSGNRDLVPNGGIEKTAGTAMVKARTLVRETQVPDLMGKSLVQETQSTVKPVEGMPEASGAYLTKLTGDFHDMYIHLAELGIEIPDIREALLAACASFEDVLARSKIPREVARESLKPVLARIAQDEQKARGTVLTATRYVRDKQHEVQKQVSAMVDRLVAVGVLKEKNPQIAEFLDNTPHGMEMINGLLIASVQEKQSGTSDFHDRHQELMEAFDAYVHGKNGALEGKRKDIALWTLARTFLSEGFMEMLNLSVTPFTSEAMLGALGERYVGPEEVRDFVEKEQGIDAIATQVREGTGKYFHVQFASTQTGRKQSLTWYPEGAFDRPNDTNPDNVQTLKDTIHEYDMLTVYETKNVMQWLSDLPNNALVDVHTKIPTGYPHSEWKDADITIMGHDLDLFTVRVNAVGGQPVTEENREINGQEQKVFIDAQGRIIDPNFTGEFSAEEGKLRCDIAKNCVLELLARSQALKIRAAEPAKKNGRKRRTKN